MCSLFLKGGARMIAISLIELILILAEVILGRVRKSGIKLVISLLYYLSSKTPENLRFFFTLRTPGRKVVSFPSDLPEF